MAKVVISLRIMPESPEINLETLKPDILQEIENFAGKGETRTEIVPIAFGLNAMQIIFVMEEAKGSTEPLEEEITKIKGVNSVEVTDVRRAVG
ncbi:MAG: elongation factor 1-beta [Candidatus Woesearchaeota archaeon]